MVNPKEFLEKLAANKITAAECFNDLTEDIFKISRGEFKGLAALIKKDRFTIKTIKDEDEDVVEYPEEFEGIYDLVDEFYRMLETNFKGMQTSENKLRKEYLNQFKALVLKSKSNNINIIKVNDLLGKLRKELYKDELKTFDDDIKPYFKRLKAKVDALKPNREMTSEHIKDIRTKIFKPVNDIYNSLIIRLKHL